MISNGPAYNSFMANYNDVIFFYETALDFSHVPQP
jgi:hypothetical protein